MAGFKVLCLALCILTVRSNPFPYPSAEANAHPNPSPKSEPTPDPLPSPSSSGPNALADPKSEASPESKPEADPTARAKPTGNPAPKSKSFPIPKEKSGPRAHPTSDSKSSAEGEAEGSPSAKAKPQQSSRDTGRRFGSSRGSGLLNRNEDEDKDNENFHLSQLPFFDASRLTPGSRGNGGFNSANGLNGLTGEDSIARLPHLPRDPKMLRPIPLSSDGRLLIGDNRNDIPARGGLEVPVGTGIIVRNRQPSTPFGNNFGSPFDNPSGIPFDNSFNRPFDTSNIPQIPFSGRQPIFPASTFPGRDNSRTPGFENSTPLFLNPGSTNSNLFPIPTTIRPFSPTSTRPSPSVFTDHRDRRPTFSSIPTSSPPLLFNNPSDGNTFSRFPASSPPFLFNPSDGNTFSGSTPRPFSPNPNDSPSIFINPSNSPTLFQNPNIFSSRNPSLFVNPQGSDTFDPQDTPLFFLNPADGNSISQSEIPLFFRDPSSRRSPPFFINPEGTASFSPDNFSQRFPSARPDFARPTITSQFTPRPTTHGSFVPFQSPFNPGSFSSRPGSVRPAIGTNFIPTTSAPFFPTSNRTPRPTTISTDHPFFQTSTPIPGINSAFPSNPSFNPFFGADNDNNNPFVGSSQLFPTTSNPRFPVRDSSDNQLTPTLNRRPVGGLFPRGPSSPYAPGYAYGYSVRDPQSGNYHGAEESKGPAGVVRGSYHLLQPDGLTRLVAYTADDIKGFQATVRYLPIAHH